jgi:hypothetical protein
MNLRDYLALREAYDRGDDAVVAALLMGHLDWVMGAIRNEIGASAGDDPPLKAHREPVMIRVGLEWAHDGATPPIMVKMPYASVFELQDVGKWLAKTCEVTNALAHVNVVKPEKAVIELSRQIQDSELNLERLRGESWRMQRMKLMLEGFAT